MIAELVVDLLKPFAEFILPGFYVAFVGGTLLMLALADRRFARRLWLGGFLSALLVVTVLGAPIVPVVDMHKFAEPTPEEQTYHELRVVDEDGQEIRYDTRAVPPVQGTRTSALGHRMVHRYDDGRRLELAAFLIREAEEYRESVLAGPRLHERLEPPRYVDEARWTPAAVGEMSSFETIRVYRHTVVFSADSTTIESRETALALEVTPEDGTVELGEGTGDGTGEDGGEEP